MEQQYDDGYWAFAADALLQRLDAMDLEADGVRKGEDIEYVHRMRVASRRLRSAISIFDACLVSGGLNGFKKPVRRITRELGAARDIDVQLEALEEFMQSDPDPAHIPGLERLALRLRQQREHLQASVVAAIDRLQGSTVWLDMQRPLREIGVRAQLRGIKADSVILRGNAIGAIAVDLEGLLSHETYIEQPSKIEELHQMRIAAKKLRYTIEVFAPLFDKNLNEGLAVAKEAQKILGEIHDCDVWIQMLPAFHEQERERTQSYFGHLRHFNRLAGGIEHMRAEKIRERAAHYEEFVAFWRETRAQGTWEKFHQTLYLPQLRVARSNAAWSGVLAALAEAPASASGAGTRAGTESPESAATLGTQLGGT